MARPPRAPKPRPRPHAIDGNAIDSYGESRAEEWRAGQENYDPEDQVAYMNNILEIDAFAVESPVIDGYRRQ